MLVRLVSVVALSATIANAHLAAWHKGMYGLNGVSGSINYNSDDVVHPLYQMSKSDWWFHGYNGVPNFPPAEGDFLELPAGGSFTVEIASNRGETSLGFNGKYATSWPDGKNYPEDYNVPTCITSPNMHTQNQSRAAGTAFAISYTSDIKKVTPENLAVFTVRYHTPWKRLTSYDVPADMPACPSGGCICAWGWVPNGCGQPNMYHLPYRCKVTGAKSTKAIGPAKAPVWCENNAGGCTKGPKQMIYWNQNEGNNIRVDGWDAAGDPKSPAYNSKCGFPDGAQYDIFTGGTSSPPSNPPPSSNDDNKPSSNADKSSSNTDKSASTDTQKKVATTSNTSSSSSDPAPKCEKRSHRKRRADMQARANSVTFHRRRHAHHGL
ncbi:hypothetical protein MIND_00989700 [Mycena indigotica]|uniref:Uncharacterized protein n=1 Tax=Mycena indigotica TaxID=2126181 RepID=A0A8H6S8V6_9AGAR|nr:uncharacterized protein MIND_00989700 [Mycena indigotica]KAF7294532.1 hypothetical protein MIND_00989700 [Mycena indigotica]